MFSTLVGPDSEKTGKLTKDKLLMKKNKRLSQKLITLKKLEHLFPPSKIRMIKLTHHKYDRVEKVEESGTTSVSNRKIKLRN